MFREEINTMNGHKILNTSITVDIWKRDTEKCVHFLSHCHADHIVGLTSTWRLPIYTTHFNAWMLKNRFKVEPSLLRCLDVGESHIISVPKTGEEFTVTLIDANHCPGSVMFLFQGSFGTILYTGDFRYDPVMLENEVLAHVMKNELLDVLYIDNTYASPKCKIPSRAEAIQQAIQIIRDHPDHRILLGLRTLGKEELLREIALEFCERICVSEERLNVLRKLKYEDVFTTDPESCRIHVVNFNSVTVSHMQQRQKKHPHIAILPTALYKCGIDENIPYKNSVNHGIYVIPYGDHSPYEELFTFVSRLKPTKIYPIVNKIDEDENKTQSYWELIKTFSIIPEGLYQLCSKREMKNINCQNKEQAISCATKKLNALPSEKSCGIKSTKSIIRPGIIRNKRIQKASVKKGVTFYASDMSDETSQTVVKHTTELEREEVIIRMPGNKHTRVRIPYNVKNNLSEVQVKLFDISNLWKGVPGILSRLNASNRETLLKDLTRMHSGDEDKELTCNQSGKTSPHVEGDGVSEQLDNFPSTCRDLDNSFQQLTPAFAMYIKDITVKEEKSDDHECMSINSVSTVMAPQTISSDKDEKKASNIDIGNDEQTFGDTFSKDEEMHKHGTFSDNGSESLLSGNAMVNFPSNADGDNRLWESSELEHESVSAAEEMKVQFKKKIRRSFCRRNEQTSHVRSTHRRNKRKRARVEPVNNLYSETDSSSSDASFRELNRMGKRSKYCNKNKSMSPNIDGLPHPWCPSYSNSMDTSRAHDRRGRTTMNTGCGSNLDKASCNRPRSVSVKYLHTENDSSDTDMQESETESWSQDNLAPTLLNCSNVQPLSKKNKVFPDPSTYSKKLKYSTILTEENKLKSGSKLRESNVTLDQENVGTFDTATCEREGITPCNAANNGMEEFVNIQSSGLSHFTCTNSEERAKKNNLTKGSTELVCLSGQNRVILPLEPSASDVLFYSAGYTKNNQRARKSHVENREKDSNISQSDESLYYTPLSSDNWNVPQTNQQQHSVGVQCELLCDLSGFCHSEVCPAPIQNQVIKSTSIHLENPVGIVNSLGKMEVVSTKPASINSSQSKGAEKVNAANWKKVSSKLSSKPEKPSNISNLGSRNNPEENNASILDDVDESFNLGKRSNHDNGRSRNKDDKLLQNNNGYQINRTFQIIDQPEGITTDKSSQHDENNKGTTNMAHNIRNLNNKSKSEASRKPQNMKYEPSTNEVDCNYWTNGNSTPFAMVEVYLAARKISSAFQEGKILGIQPSPCHTTSESSSTSRDKDGYCQHNHIAASVQKERSIQKHAEEGKQSIVPVLTVLTNCSYEYSINKHTSIEQYTRKMHREINCSNDSIEAHTIPAKAKSVNDSTFHVVEGSSGRMAAPQNTMNKGQIKDKTDVCFPVESTAKNRNSTALHLNSSQESFIGSSRHSIVGSTRITCEQIINDHVIVPESPEGSDDCFGKNGAVLEIPERSDDLPDENDNDIAPESPEGSDDLPGENGNDVPQSPEESDDFLSKRGAVPETPEISNDFSGETESESLEGSDDLLSKIGAVPEKRERSVDLPDDNDIIPESPEGSDNFLSKRDVPETPERTKYDLPGENDSGIAPKSLEDSDYLLSKRGAVPETPEKTNDLPGENDDILPESLKGSNDSVSKIGAVPEIPERSDDFLGANDNGIKPEGTDDSGIVQDTPKGREVSRDENMVAIQMNDSSKSNSTLTPSSSNSGEKFNDAGREVGKYIGHIDSSASSELMPCKMGSSNEVLQCTVKKEKHECSKDLICTIRQVAPLESNCNSNKMSVLNDHTYSNIFQNEINSTQIMNEIIINPARTSVNETHVAPCQQSRMSTEQNVDSGTSNISNSGQDFNRILSSMKIQKVEFEMHNHLFTKNNKVIGKKAERSIRISNKISSANLFPSGQVNRVSRTHVTTNHSKNVSSKYVVQNPKNIYIYNVITEISAKKATFPLAENSVKKATFPHSFQNQTKLRTYSSETHLKRRRLMQSSSASSSSQSKLMRLSDAT